MQNYFFRKYENLVFLKALTMDRFMEKVKLFLKEC